MEAAGGRGAAGWDVAGWAGWDEGDGEGVHVDACVRPAERTSPLAGRVTALGSRARRRNLWRSEREEVE